MACKTQILKFLLFSVVLFTNYSFAQDALKVSINDFSGGQNSYDLPDVINANQGISMQNVVISKKGQLQKRKGQALFANDVSNTRFYGIGDFYPDATTSYVLAASGPYVIRSTPAGVDWVILNSEPINQLTANKDTEFVQANNRLFILNGYDETAIYDGTNWDLGGVFPSSPPIGTTSAWLRNYLFVAGNSINTDWLYISNNLDPMTWSSGSNGIIKVNTGDGQKIMKIEPFRLNELAIYKEGSIYVLDITGSTIADWTLQPIIRSIGCIAPRSVVNIGNDQWFLSSDPIAVRSLVRSAFDKILLDMVSQPIQDIFDGTGDVRINTTYISKACAILYDNKYLLAIPTGVSTTNDYVVVYDFITKSWNTIKDWYADEWLEFNNNLYYIDETDGRVVQCFTGTIGDMASGPIATSANEPTRPIEFDYISKNINFDNKENYKELDALEIMFEPSGNYNATISVELDDSGWQNVGTISLASDAPTLPINLPFTLAAAGLAKQTLQLQKYGEFRKAKARIQQNGLSEQCNLHSLTIFANMKEWRRED